MAEHPCAGMTKAQREAFERIAVNQPPMATHKTLLALRSKGLIGYTDKVVGRDALGKITVPEWFVPIHVHYQWCEWCGENVPDGDPHPAEKTGGVHRTSQIAEAIIGQDTPEDDAP